jgi:3-hydroxybutyrate dehydrogenase
MARTALVTGPVNLLAQAFAEALAADGHRVMLNEPDAGKVEPMLARLVELGAPEAANEAADPRDGEAMAGLVEAVVARWQRIDVVVNAAALQHVAPLEAFPPERFAEIVAVNLGAAFHTTRTALPYMRARRFGRIVNQASVHGLVASARKSAYVASKHGLVGLTKTTALETAGSGITCNAICPGFTGTESTQQQARDLAAAEGVSLEEANARLLAKQPSGQWIPVADLGRICAFLASDAAAHVTGACLPVDGGWSAQ